MRRHMVGRLHRVDVGLRRRSLVRCLSGLVAVLVDVVCAFARKRERDVARILRIESCRCSRLDFPCILDRAIARAVIGLCVWHRMAIRIYDIELIRIDRLPCDRPLSVGIGVNRIVARRYSAECILKRRVHVMIDDIMSVRRRTRIGVIAKGRTAFMSIGARRTVIVAPCAPCRAERRLRDGGTLAGENGADHAALRIIRDGSDRAGGIGCRVVRGGILCIRIVDLRYGCHRDIQLTRRDLARIRHVVEHGRDVLSPARLHHRTELGIRMIRIDDLIVVRICARELGGIVHCLRHRFFLRIIENILIDVGSCRAVYRHPRRIVNETVREATILIEELELDHILTGHRCRSRIPVALRIARYAVIGLVEVLHRLRDNLGRGNSPRCDDCVGMGCIDCFEITFIGARCAEVVIRERADTLVMRIRDDIVRNIFRLRFVRGAIRPRHITGKMSLVPRHRKEYIVFVLVNDACIRSGRRRLCDKRLPGLQRKDVRAVIGSRRIGNPAVLVAHLKARLFDQAAVDRALAVDGVVDCVVVLLCRSECFLQDIANVLITYVVLRTVARIHILAKGIPRAASEGTMRRSCRQHCLMLCLQRGRRNTIIREDGRSNGVARRLACKPRDVALRIDSSAVIDLVHRPHSDGDGAGRNRARIASRDCRTIRNRRRIRRLVKGIVIHLVARAAVKLRRVRHRLQRGSVRRIIPCDIRRCVHRRRGVRA